MVIMKVHTIKKLRLNREIKMSNRLKASTDRPAWLPTLEQGRGSGLTAYKHKLCRRGQGNETVLVRNYDWSVNANAVKVEGER